MVKKKNRQKIIGISSIVILLFIGSYFGGLFSFIGDANLGEEGFESYDVLLASDTYNPPLWNSEYETEDIRAYRFFAHIESDSNSYDKSISVNNGVITLKGGSDYTGKECFERDGVTRCISMGYELRPFNKEDIIIKFKSVLTDNGNKGVAGENIIYVDDSLVYKHIGTGTRRTCTATESSTIEGVYSSCSYSSTLEVRWNDYETNKYQVFVNNVAVTGIKQAVNGEINIKLIPNPRLIDFQRNSLGYFEIEKFITRPLFGCDPQEGEVLADMTFTDTTFDMQDLIGFKRFCTDVPSLFNAGGVITSTNRIYYNLAGGESVSVGSNEAYRIFYIADGVETGALDCSSGESYSVTEDECLDTTGFASICNEGSILIDNVCVTKITDEVDFDSKAEIVGDDTIQWSANGDNPTFNSIGSQLFSAGTPTYSCRSIDGHDDKDRINYPQPTEDCWTFLLNDNEISVGDTQQLDSYWAISLNNAQASLRYDIDNGQNGEFEEGNDWGMDMNIVLKQPFVDISARYNSQLELGGIGEVELDVNNKLLTDVNGFVEIVVSPETIDNTLVLTKELTLPSGSSIQTIDLPTAYLGGQDTLIFFTLRTDAGNLLASNVYEASYEVVDVVEDSGTEVIVPTNKEVDITQDNIQKIGLGTTIAIIFAILVLFSIFFIFNKKKGGRK